MLGFHDFPVSGVALFVALIAGVVRGFSGFGSALVFVPLMAALYDLRTAITTMVLIDVAAGFWIAVSAWRDANLREVRAVFLAALAGIPMGVIALVYGNPVCLRWAMAAFVAIGALVVTLGGWRYQGSPNRFLMGTAGLAAGFFGTVFQMDGPPAVILWLGSDRTKTIVRANTAVFLEFTGALIVAVYAIKGWISHDIITMAFRLFWPFLVGVIVGSLRFHRMSEDVYRWTACGLILLAAIVSLPIFGN